MNGGKWQTNFHWLRVQMFMVYNGVLRAMSTGGKIPAWGGAHAGESVQGRFTTTIHAINSGVVKLSRIQPAFPVSFIGVGRLM